MFDKKKCGPMDLRADFGSRHSMLSFETHLPLNSAASMAFCEPAKLITNKYIYITVMHDCAHEYTRSTIYIYIYNMCVCCIIYWLMLSVYFYEIFIYIFIYWFIYCFIKYFFKYISYVCIYIYIYIVLEWVSTWPSCDPWHPKTIVHAANLGRHLQCMVPSVWYITNFHQFHYQHFFKRMWLSVTKSNSCHLGCVRQVHLSGSNSLWQMQINGRLQSAQGGGHFLGVALA